MTDNVSTGQPESIRQLAQATENLAADDLTTLAQMHGWVAGLAGGDAPAPEQLVELTAVLENLIIGTVDDAEAALRRVTELIGELAGDVHSALGNGAVDSPAAEDSPSVAETPADANIASDPTLARLQSAVQRVDATELTLLAEMHTDCQQLAEQSAGDTARVKQCAALAELIETLIMGTEDDPSEIIRALRAGIAELTSVPGAAAPCPAPESNSPVNDENGMTDGELGARLDAVFADGGDAPTPEDAPATVDPPTTAVAAAPPEPAAVAADDAQPPYISEPLLIDAKELEFVVAFIEEAGEHIENIEAALLEVEQAPNDADKINELFRPFHTIKGMAGFLNLRDVNCLTHEVETLLDQGRRGERTMSAGIIDIVFEVIDILKTQIAEISAYAGAPTDKTITQPPVADMIDRLRAVVARRIDPDAGAGNSPRARGSQEAQAPPPAATATDAVAPPPAPASAKPAADAPQTSKPVVTEQSVRIDTGKLDALVDMVGELVIAQTLITSSPAIAEDAILSKNASQVSKIVRNVQEAAMAMRMIPIKSTFQKMARLVRDLSRKAGKHVELAIAGEETELDKNVIQQIGDPLVHMVRNAVDHGIESAEDRAAAGKSETGHVRLRAFHRSGNIVIEIRDDGKGLDPEILKAKAIEKGIIEPDNELTDEQAYNLIFAAGFSTAAKITDVSGRGVGMDVVRRNIEQLRGRVEITSEKGRGSTFSIQLPLTLAIIDGMLVRVGAERFIIPTPMIEQALRPEAEQISTVQNRGELLNVRGKLIPLIQLGQLFQFGERVRPSDAMVVTAHTDSGDIGLVVDELIGQQQVVIKSLGERFQGLRGLSGAAILGDGKVGLILDPSGVRTAHESWRGAIIRKDATTAPAPEHGEGSAEGDDGAEVPAEAAGALAIGV